jgi:hypothetical protein
MNLSAVVGTHRTRGIMFFFTFLFADEFGAPHPTHFFFEIG